MHFSDEAQLLISFPGEIFLRILKLLTLPLLLSCLITVSASINPKVSGRMTIKTISYFASTSMVSAIVGILIALVLRPGTINSSSVESNTVGLKLKFVDSMLDLGR